MSPEPNHTVDVALAKTRIAVIEVNPEHRQQVTRALNPLYDVAAYAQFDHALDCLAEAPPCVVLLDEAALPRRGGNPVALLRAQLAGVPIIRTLNHALAHLGSVAADADACLEKPFRRSSLIRAISGQVNRSVEKGWQALPDQYRDSLQRSVESFNAISDQIDRGEPLVYQAINEACSPLVDAVSKHDFKVILDNVKGHDNYSYVHSLRVATLLSLFGHTIGLKGDDLSLLATGGLVHDIGKATIPQEVLNKPGRLNDAELEVMRSHVPRAIDYLSLCETLPKGVVTIAAQHHEKINGEGYPMGLRNGELNELARMASIVDIFSALTDRRVYKEPMAPEAALALMTDRMAGEIDLALLALFKGMLLDAVAC